MFMAFGGRMFAVCSPQSNLTRESECSAGFEELLHAPQVLLFESLLNTNSGLVMSTVNISSASRLVPLTRNLIAVSAPIAPAMPVMAGVTPNVSQLSANLSDTRGIMHSRHGVLGGLRSAKCACSA